LEINLLAETERVELLLVPGHPCRETGALSVCFDVAQTLRNDGNVEQTLYKSSQCVTILNRWGVRLKSK